jgi:inhibitor of the pro-sigma K processing machinery
MMLIEIVYIIGALVLLWLIVKFFSLSARLLYNGVLGAAMLWLLNLFGSAFGLSLEMNILNALIAGFLGIPGVLFLLFYKYYL